MIARIDTQRLLLRALSIEDVDALVAVDSDPAVMRYINGGRATPRVEVEEVVRRSLSDRWFATDKEIGAFFGWFALDGAGAGTSDLELGYRLRREAWGRGLATEGARALIAVAFTRLGAHRVWAQTMTVNAASRRVLERCGLRYVRTFHLEWTEPIEGSELGDVEYELLRIDWERVAGLKR